MKLLNKLLGRHVTRTCSTCAHSHRKRIKGDTGMYEIVVCRRYPPKYVLIANTSIRGGIDVESRVRHPSVAVDDTCGEWQKR